MSDSLEYRQALGQFPTGVTVITASDAKGKPVGMTANSFSSVSLDPKLVLWSIAKSASAYDDLIDANHFAIHVLAESQQLESNQFSQKEGNRFEGIDYEFNSNGVPLLNHFAARFECELEEKYAGGDHIIILGRVIAFKQTEAKALVFYRGQYAAVDTSNDG